MNNGLPTRSISPPEADELHDSEVEDTQHLKVRSIGSILFIQIEVIFSKGAITP